ncbi:MAG TPA: helix-turn-helix transcriptional regulator [Thermoanaerobaculia bacterium]|jgi:transcriptional regulator with XRE-family HTH domain
MQKPKPDLVCGGALEAARVAQNVTKLRLSKLSGVSRKHITDAEAGLNITRDVLKKLMRALNLRQIRFDDGSVAELGRDATATDPATAVALAEGLAQLQQAIELMQHGVDTIRQTMLGSVPKQDVAMNQRATTLIHDFTRVVKDSRTSDELEAVERTVAGLARAPKRTRRKVTSNAR